MRPPTQSYHVVIQLCAMVFLVRCRALTSTCRKSPADAYCERKPLANVRLEASSALFISSSIFATSARHLVPICQGSRPGDCDPVSCGGTCESRYIRFFDRVSKTDRTTKNCQCSKEKICSIIGMHPHAGCRSYSTLSAAGQRLIRLWSLDGKDRRLRFSNNIRNRFSDKERHQQLINGNSRFCCRSITPKKARAMRLHGSAVGERGIVIVIPLIIMLIFTR